MATTARCRAFIKSMRGNDVDATLYWLATMVAAGEDPRFICRRIVICASEDVGNADPRALQVAVAAAGALELVGLPEAQYALAQAAAYVAAAPKSNRVGQAYFAARGGRRVTWLAAGAAASAARQPPPDEDAMASVSAIATRTTTRARTWSSSTCPTCSRARATTCPSDQGMEANIGARLARSRRGASRAAATKAG